MHILAINPLWPQPKHTIRAANVVIFEILKELAIQRGVRLGFLKVSDAGEPDPSLDEQKGIELLKKNNITILTPLKLPDLATIKTRSKLARILWPKMVDFYKEATFKKLAHSAIDSFKPDVLFIPWTERCTVLFADFPALKFAYYGNPDPKLSFAMNAFNFKHSCIGITKYLIKYYLLKRFEKLHLNVIRKYEILADVAANDAKYYTRKKHPNAFYLQNVWIDRFGSKRIAKRKKNEKHSPAIIVGNIGKLDGAANTHGLEILLKHVAPALRKIMTGIPYEIHIFGARTFHPAIKKYIVPPEIKICGFVPDIDKELLLSTVFLCVNNASKYKVGHTRYLHAWSLGCCVVAHTDAALSMPEIKHGENALLGSTPLEIAQQIKKAITNPELRGRIGEGGYVTFKKYFTAKKVVPKIITEINKWQSNKSA